MCCKAHVRLCRSENSAKENVSAIIYLIFSYEIYLFCVIIQRSIHSADCDLAIAKTSLKHTQHNYTNKMTRFVFKANAKLPSYHEKAH